MGFLNSDDYSSIKHVVRTTIDYVMGYLVSDDSYIALPDFTIILFKGKITPIASPFSVEVSDDMTSFVRAKLKN